MKYSEAAKEPNTLVYSSAPIMIEKTERERTAGFMGFLSSVEVEFSSAGDVSDCPLDDAVFSDSGEVGEFCCEAASDVVADSIMNGFING